MHSAILSPVNSPQGTYGPIGASVFASGVGDGTQYRCGRDACAAIGFVPRQHSSGGKSVLLGISKREQEGAHGLGDPAQ